jgi:hypothetical protein
MSVRRERMKQHDREVFIVKPKPQQPFVSNDDALLKRKRKWSINRPPPKIFQATIEHIKPDTLIKDNVAKTRRGGKNKRRKTRKKRKRRKTRRKKKHKRRHKRRTNKK